MCIQCTCFFSVVPVGRWRFHPDHLSAAECVQFHHSASPHCVCSSGSGWCCKGQSDTACLPLHRSEVFTILPCEQTARHCHRTSKLTDTRRMLQSLSQKFSVWKDWKSFRSPDEMLQELQDPSAEYTVLIPPKSDLQRLNDAIETGYLQREDARGSLLKHILLGRHTLADFKSIPNDGMCAPLNNSLHTTLVPCACSICCCLTIRPLSIGKVCKHCSSIDTENTTKGTDSRTMLVVVRIQTISEIY